MFAVFTFFLFTSLCFLVSLLILLPGRSCRLITHYILTLSVSDYFEICDLQKKQHTVTRDREETDLIARGRHDPCVVPRGNLFFVFLENPLILFRNLLMVLCFVHVAVPMVEAMAALVLVNQLMAHKGQNELFPVTSPLQEPIPTPAPL
jgi:hypothetical protein